MVRGQNLNNIELVSMADLIPANRGYGKWIFEIYHQDKVLESINGFLMITKDHHTIFEEAACKTTLLSIPSQNVSYVKQEK
jgi:hypothetical protein